MTLHESRGDGRHIGSRSSRVRNMTVTFLTRQEPSSQKRRGKSRIKEKEIKQGYTDGGGKGSGDSKGRGRKQGL